MAIVTPLRHRLLWIGLAAAVALGACSPGGGGARDTVITAENVMTLGPQLKQQLTVEEGDLLEAYVRRVHPELPTGQLPIGQSAQQMIEAQKAFLVQGGANPAVTAAAETLIPAEAGPAAGASPTSPTPLPPPPPKKSASRQPPAPSPATGPAAETAAAAGPVAAPETPSAPAPAPPPEIASAPEPAPAPRIAPLPSGLPVRVRLLDALSSKTAATGQAFSAHLDADLLVDDLLVAPEGSRVVGKVTHSRPSGKVEGKAEMALTITRIEVGDASYTVSANTLSFQAESTKKEDVKKVGIGAGAGAIIGAIAGGKKGALIGGAIGAGAGTGVALATPGDEVEFKPEQRFEFRLEKELQLPVIPRQ